MESATPEAETKPTTPLRTVVLASAAGTAFEWYDFFVFGSLIQVISKVFFSGLNETTAYIAALALFGAGFVFRPLGALVFGRIGDRTGRKGAFLVTVVLMGVATVAIGLLPTYQQVGLISPALLVLMRIIQGFALGGEYGGAATYVAEHAPDDKRGYYTSFIQTTATLGFFMALGVVLVTRLSVGDEDFKAWGWRLPFLMSALLLALSIFIRMKLQESPLFARLKSQGRTSTAPLTESFGNRKNWKLILLALFGATAGQATVWYTGQFYALFFLQTVLKVGYVDAYVVVAIALALGTPFFLVFGWLSDRWGRKVIMMTGCLIAALTYVPIYKAMAANVTPVNHPVLVLLVFIQVIYVTMVYGPIAAYLVELFPARIRYTSMSLPYHIGNGWFGGFTPLIASAIVAATGDVYAGLYYPIGVTLMTFVVGTLLLKETRHVRIWDEVGKPD